MANRLILSLCIALFILCGCKARKVAKEATDSVATHKEVISTAIVKTHTDTSKKIDNTKKLVLISDSGTTETVITPDDKPFVLNSGVFTGTAKSIVITHKGVVKKTVNSDKSITTTSGVKDSSSSISQALVKDSVSVKKTSKTVDAKPSNGWLIYVIIGGILLAVIVLWWFFGKPKG